LGKKGELLDPPPPPDPPGSPAALIPPPPPPKDSISEAPPGERASVVGVPNEPELLGYVPPFPPDPTTTL
jgi:hypothetical protein